jgi:HAMP domain-containing protein
MAGQAQRYEPPDPTRIEAGDPQALRFWAGTLDRPAEEIGAAVSKVGPMLEDVKRELGIAGV